MKKRIVLLLPILAAAFVMISLTSYISVTTAKAANDSDYPQWIKSWDEFLLDIPADRSINNMIEKNDLDFRYVETSLSDNDYCSDQSLTGNKIVHICKLGRSTTFEEIRLFIKKRGGQLPDAQTLMLVFEARHQKMKNNAWMIAVIDPQFAPVGRSEILIWNRKFPVSHHKEINRFFFEIANSYFGGRENDYFIYLTEAR